MFGLILPTSNPFILLKKLGSANNFLIESQSTFSSNKIATHSRVNLTIGYGLLFDLISEISFLLSVFNAS